MGDLAIDGNGFVVGEKAYEMQDLPDCLPRPMPGKQDVRHDGCTRVDKGIAWNAFLVLQLDDGVEGAS
jgi:hypothetical protein